MDVEVAGAAGGSSYLASGLGGFGAIITTSIAVVPGQVIYLYIGGKGGTPFDSNGGLGGFNGGAPGHSTGSGANAGGGGGNKFSGDVKFSFSKLKKGLCSFVCCRWCI